MARVDYYNDPNAPKANSLVPSVTAIVPNEQGAILMVHKTDNDLWALPGGEWTSASPWRMPSSAR
jgi:hypothetical protein